MALNRETLHKNPTRESLLLDICRRNPRSFISFGGLHMEFGWPVGSVREVVGNVIKQLDADAMYTISLESGIVYEPQRVHVGERIYPSKFRPDPHWLLDEFPERTDLGMLLAHLRFVTVGSQTKAFPVLTPSEHSLFIHVLADNARKSISSAAGLSRVMQISEANVRGLLSQMTKKITAATQGEWTITNEKRGGRYYVLRHK